MNRRIVLKTCLTLCLGLSGLFLFTHVFSAQPNDRPAQTGVVHGRVTFDDGRPAVGFRVVARTFPAWPRNDAEAVTDRDGQYRLPLSDGADRLPVIGFFSGPRGLRLGQFGILVDTGDGPYLETPPQIVTLPPSTPTPAKPADLVADFVLHLGPQVTVRVRDAETGLPVAQVPVELAPDAYSSGFHPVGRTDAGGVLRLRISHLNTDLRLNLQGRTPQIGPAPGSRSQDQIRLTGVHDVLWDVWTYENPDQPKAVTFRGLVTGKDGLPVQGALVRFGQAQTVTDSQGRFSFGTHRMTEYESESRSVFLIAEKGEQRALALPTPEQTWTTIPLRLGLGQTATLTGVAVDARDRPLAGVPFRYWGVLKDSLIPDPTEAGVTDASGRFEISGLFPDAGYTLTLGGRPPGAAAPLYGVTTVPQCPQPDVQGSYAMPMRLQANERRDLGRIVVPRADAVVTGRVVDVQGRPATTALDVVIAGAHCEVHLTPDADGRFRTANVVREPLTLSVYASEGGPGTSQGFSEGPTSPDLIRRMAVRAGTENLRVTVASRRAATPPAAPTPVPRREVVVPPLTVTFIQETLPICPGRGPVRDQVQALHVARRFLDAIGWSGNLAAQRYPPRFFPGAAPQWGVQIRSDVSDASIPNGGLSIAADTGEVTDMYSDASNAPADISGPRLTQAQVLDRARSVFRAGGITREYDIQGISTSGAERIVSLRPLFHGIPTELIGFGQMRLDARTGRLRTLMLPESWATDPPSALPAVDRVHALRAASAVWAGPSPSETPDIYAQLWVVPDPTPRHPPIAGVRLYSPPVGRLAWIVRRKPPAPDVHEVWVDAQNGAILPAP